MDPATEDRWLTLVDDDPRVVDVKVFGFETVPDGWAVDYPAGLPEHLVYLVVAGGIGGRADGHTVQLGPGSLLWLRPRVPFTFAVADGRPPTLYRFRIAVGPVGDMAPVTVLPDAWELRAAFDSLVTEFGADLPYRDRRIRAALTLTFTTIFRLLRPRRDGRTFDARQRQRLELFVDAHIADRLTPGDLARHVDLSSQYFTRRFRQTYGIPPKVWLVRRRVQHAASRLDESQETITAIAAGLGYPDVFLFSRQFTSVMGVSPRHYRARGTAAGG